MKRGAIIFVMILAGMAAFGQALVSVPVPVPVPGIAIGYGNNQQLSLHSNGYVSVTFTNLNLCNTMACPVTFSIANDQAWASLCNTSTATCGWSSSATVSSVNGVATAYFTTGSMAGTYTITATVASGASTSFSMTNLPGPAAHITAKGGSGQTAAPGKTFAPLQALVTDADGNPVPNSQVIFATPASQPSVLFSDGEAYIFVSTDGQGIATSPGLTAGTSPGTYTVVGALAGIVAQGAQPSTQAANPASFQLSVGDGILLACNSAAGPAQVGVAYSDTCSASGGKPLYSFQVVGSLPPGLKGNISASPQVLAGTPSAEVISGTPSAAGSYNYTVTLTDSLGLLSQQTFTGTIKAAAAAPPPVTATPVGGTTVATTPTAPLPVGSTTQPTSTPTTPTTTSTQTTTTAPTPTTPTQTSTTTQPTQSAPVQTATVSSLGLAHFAVGGTWTTGFFVLNMGAQAANFSVNFYDDGGNPTALPLSTGSATALTGTLPAQGSAYFEASNPQSATQVGWGQIVADPSIMIQALFRNSVDGAFYEASIPSAAASQEIRIPFDATTFTAGNEPFYTGFAIANLDSVQANISCITRDSSGNEIPSAVVVPNISALGHWADYQFPLLANQRGTIDCTSNTNIVATAFRFLGTNAFSSLPVITNPSMFASTGPASRALAHFASGTQWTTGLYIINTSEQTAQYSLTFYDDTGAPATLPFDTGSSSTLAGALLGNGSAYFEAGNPQLPVSQGWAQINSDPAIAVQALFRENASGAYYEASVPASSGSKEFVIPFDATTFAGNGSPFYTGMAIANLDQTAATVSCTARDASGAIIPNGVTVPQLNALGHWAGYQFPALAGLRGTVDCVSANNMAALALRFIGTTAFSSLPVVQK